MSVFLPILRELKTRLNENATLNALVKTKLFGNREKVYNEATELPVLILEIGPRRVLRMAFPKRQQEELSFQIRIKAVDPDTYLLIEKILELDEKIRNAIEGTDPTFGNLVVWYEILTTEDKLIGDNTREAIIQLTLRSQPFTAGER